MRKSGFSALFCGIVILISVWAMYSAPIDPKPVMSGNFPEQFHGSWVVKQHAINGMGDTEFVGASLSITASTSASIVDSNGSTQLLEFQQADAVDPDKFQLLVTADSDSEEMGGGGSRKAVLRIDNNGDLEMVEVTSADDDYPSNFSQSQNQSIYWKLVSAPR